MSAIKRQKDQTERYGITASWLYEFAHDLEKKSGSIDYLKEYLDSQKKKKGFSTIEEKLADIKDRVGFDLARKISEETNKAPHKISAEASTACACQNTCQSCQQQTKTAQQKHSEKDVKAMENVLKYIQDMVRHESHLDVGSVISRCRAEEGLGFSELRIDLGKLRKYIEGLLAEHQEEHASATYIPKDRMEIDLAEDMQADYYNHANPSLG